MIWGGVTQGGGCALHSVVTLVALAVMRSPFRAKIPAYRRLEKASRHYATLPAAVGLQPPAYSLFPIPSGIPSLRCAPFRLLLASRLQPTASSLMPLLFYLARGIMEGEFGDRSVHV